MSIQKLMDLLGELFVIVELYINGEKQLLNPQDELSFGKTKHGDKVEIRLHIPKNGDAVPCGFLRIQPKGKPARYEAMPGTESHYGDDMVAVSRVVEVQEEGYEVWPHNQFALIVQKGLKLKLVQISATWDEDGYLCLDELVEAPLAKTSDGKIFVRSGKFKPWESLTPFVEEHFQGLLNKLPVADPKNVRPEGPMRYTKWDSLDKGERKGGWAVCKFFNKSMRKGALEMLEDGEPDGRVVVAHANSVMDVEGFRCLVPDEKYFVEYLQNQGNTGYAEAKKIYKKRPAKDDAQKGHIEKSNGFTVDDLING